MIAGLDLTVALSAERLGKRFRGTWALADVGLDLPTGTVTALVGHNGAGKTTLLRLLAGLIAPTTGTISRGIRGSVSYVAQDKPLYPTWQVREMLEFGARMHRSWDDALVRAWLADLGVPLDRTCAKLSGGQRAQVALGLALGARPEILLLDEPMATLDPLARVELTRALLAAVAEIGVTVLLSTHQTGDLHALADRVLLLASGGAVLSDSVDALLAAHTVLEGPGTALPVPDGCVVTTESDGRRTRATVRVSGVADALHPAWTTAPIGLEQLLLNYLLASRRTVAA
jgi:ABC-2 type transport system ATP-binding protein